MKSYSKYRPQQVNIDPRGIADIYSPLNRKLGFFRDDGFYSIGDKAIVDISLAITCGCVSRTGVIVSGMELLFVWHPKQSEAKTEPTPTEVPSFSNPGYVASVNMYGEVELTKRASDFSAGAISPDEIRDRNAGEGDSGPVAT